LRILSQACRKIQNFAAAKWFNFCRVLSREKIEAVRRFVQTASIVMPALWQRAGEQH
jgi:hypothetical protein